MQTILLLVLIILVLGLATLLFLMMRQMRDMQGAQKDDKALIMINQNIQGMGERLHKATDNINLRIDKTTETISDRLDNAARVIGAVQKELGTVQERFKGFEEFNDLLHPKLRGNIGEQILADMLAQVFSDSHYQLQYKFRDGQTVDAIVRTKGGIVPIDSKFPLENFRQYTRAETDEKMKLAQREFTKAVKKHIDDISKKYIQIDEGTVNFAIMYVPSENVYYHILTGDEGALLEYAKSKSILITSPHGFFNFLRVIMMGMERSKLHEQSQKIWDILKGVQKESEKFNDSIGVLSRHITNAKNSMDGVHAGYAKLSGKIEQVNLLEEASPEEDESQEG